MRTTTRLRVALAVAVEDGRDQFEVAAAHGVSWPTVQRAVVVRGAVELVEPEAVRMLGMDETRGRGGCPTGTMTTAGSAGSARIRGRPGLSTSPVISRCWAGRRAYERSGAGLAGRAHPSVPRAYRGGAHRPHLIMLANKAVTAVRQRVTRDLLDRRGRKTDPTWANRRLLLRGRERLSDRALARMWNGCSISASPDRSCRRGSRRRNCAPLRARPPVRTPPRHPRGCGRSTGGAPTPPSRN